MVKFRAVKMIPKGSFRSVPASNQIFSSICNATLLLHGKSGLKELIEAFNDEVRISSAFPYSGDEYYLPKPLSIEPRLIEIADEDYSLFKKLKKAQYLDIRNFEDALRGKLPSPPPEVPLKKVSVPRVVLDRVSQSSNLYFLDEIHFSRNAGLYFLYSGPNDIFREYILPAMRLLEDTGIGGKSTWGQGLFKMKHGWLSIDEPESEYIVTLSHTLPSKKPVLWRLIRIGGWSYENGKTKRKPKISLVTPGSVLRNDTGRIESLDVGLGHEVHMYGKAFPVRTLIPEGAL